VVINTIQGYEDVRQQPIGEVIYLVNDAHYYLSTWRPKFEGIICTSGKIHCLFPGTYQHPYNEGNYSVSQDADGDAFITDYARSNGAPYKHKWTMLSRVEQHYNFVWIGFFRDTRSTRSWQLLTSYCPDVRTVKSTQSTHIFRYLDSLPGGQILVNLAKQRAEWEKTAFTDADLVDIA
jgi:hypothetical protein